MFFDIYKYWHFCLTSTTILYQNSLPRHSAVIREVYAQKHKRGHKTLHCTVNLEVYVAQWAHARMQCAPSSNINMSGRKGTHYPVPRGAIPCFFTTCYSLAAACVSVCLARAWTRVGHDWPSTKCIEKLSSTYTVHRLLFSIKKYFKREWADQWLPGS